MLQVLHVLVVDDSSITRKMVCKLLQSTGQCRCDQAADGSIAVEMMRRSLCTEMPIIAGTDTYRHFIFPYDNLVYLDEWFE